MAKGCEWIGRLVLMKGTRIGITLGRLARPGQWQALNINEE